LQKGIANDLFNATRLCNPNGGDFGRLINWCRNDRLRNSETDSVPLGTRHHNFRGCDSRYSLLSRELLKIRSEME
jgi:hypothetical protein